jgi:signal transduction histidine kinase
MNIVPPDDSDRPASQPDAPARDPVVQALVAYTAGEQAASAVEAERRRLAGLLQQHILEPLGLLLAQANLYEQTLSADPTARMAVSVLTSLARQVMQQARDLEANLHPTVLEALGLEPALEALASQTTRAHGLQVSLALERMRERLPVPVEQALFRAAQDALDRTVRHARASRAAVRLERREAHLQLTYTDNGLSAAGDETLRAALQRVVQLGGAVQSGFGPQGNFEMTIAFALAAPPPLTEREMQTLQLLAEGLSNKEIARALTVSPRTVNFHLDNIYSKLGVGSRTEAAIYALRQGWVRRPPGDPGRINR